MRKNLGRLLSLLAMGAIDFYRATPLLWKGRCRFYPTCSAFAREAFEKHGAARGMLLTIKRLSRCHPWSAGGCDFVPGDLQ